MIPASFGATLRTLRTRRGLTMSQLCCRAGVAERTLRNWELGTHEPRSTELGLILEALNASAEERLQLRSLLQRVPAPCPSDPEQPPPPGFGELLQALRWRQELPLAAAAERLGVSAATLSRWEHGARVPTEEHAELLAEVLDASPEERALLRQRRVTDLGLAFLSLEELAERVAALRGVLTVPANTSGDLWALPLLRALWERLPVDQGASPLLGEAAAIYSLYLTYLNRFEAARRYARLAARHLPPPRASDAEALPHVSAIFTGATLVNPRREAARLPSMIAYYRSWMAHDLSPSLRCYAYGQVAHLSCRAGWLLEAERFLAAARKSHGLIPEGSEDGSERAPLLTSVAWQLAVIGSGYRHGWDRMPDLSSDMHFATAANIHLAAARLHLKGGSRGEASTHLRSAEDTIDRHCYRSLRPLLKELQEPPGRG